MVMGENEEVGCLWFAECELWFVVCGLFIYFLFVYLGVCDCGVWWVCVSLSVSCGLRSVIGGGGGLCRFNSQLAGLSW